MGPDRGEGTLGSRVKFRESLDRSFGLGVAGGDDLEPRISASLPV